MRLHIFSVVSLVLVANVAFAQNETDVLRYSQTYMKGSARFTAMGGAFGALGGDVSSFMVNPAGVGVYRTAEFVFSSGIYNANLHSDYNGSSYFETRTAANIGNAGIVIPMFKTDEGGLRNLNIGIAYNRVNDFGMDTYTSGFNDRNSITDYFAANANGIYQNYLMSDKPYEVIIGDAPAGYNYRVGQGLPWESVMAWKTYLINPQVDNNDNYLYYSPLESGDAVWQTQNQEIRGFNDLVNISFGGNVFDLVYFGGSLNINNISYRSTKTYSEKADASNAFVAGSPRFENMYYDEIYRAYGTGYSLSLGMILKPIHELRIGLSYQSPTWNFMTEDYSAYMNSMFSNVNGNGFAEYDTPISTFDYRVHSPQKLTASVAGVIGKFAILSADLDWVNYNNMKMKGDNDYRYLFSEVNSTINDVFRNTINVRAGGELKFGALALRGGYQYYQNPYKKEYVNSDHPTQIYSGGLGFRTRDFFIDFAYSLLTVKNSYSLYDYYDGNLDVFSGLVTDNIKKNSYILTLGFKF